MRQKGGTYAWSTRKGKTGMGADMGRHSGQKGRGRHIGGRQREARDIQGRDRQGRERLGVDRKGGEGAKVGIQAG